MAKFLILLLTLSGCAVGPRIPKCPHSDADIVAAYKYVTDVEYLPWGF